MINPSTLAVSIRHSTSPFTTFCPSVTVAVQQKLAPKSHSHTHSLSPGRHLCDTKLDVSYITSYISRGFQSKSILSHTYLSVQQQCIQFLALVKASDDILETQGLGPAGGCKPQRLL